MFLGVIALLIVVPVYMLFIRDGDSPPSDSELLGAAADPNKAAEVLLEQVSDAEQGITIRYPAGWHGDTEEKTVRVKSPDSKTVVAVTTGGPADKAPVVFKEAVRGVASSYEHPRVTLAKPEQAKPVSGLSSASAIISGKLKGGDNATTLLSVARGRHTAYVVSAIVPPNGGDIGVANLILDRGLTLSG